MGSYNSTVITTVGQALLASAIANQKDVVFSKFQVSDHVYPAGTDLSALTSLQSVQKETAPSGASVYDSTTIHSSATVDNSGVLAEFNANTLGLFITVDSTEVLFGVSTAITPDVFPKDTGGVPSTYTYSMNLVVSSTENVTISVDMDAYLTAADVVDNLNTSSSTSPLSAGMGKQLGESLANAIGNESDAYSDSSTYEVGDYCIYQDQLYKCNTDISVAEAWDSTHWDATNIGDEIGQISSDLSELGQYTEIATTSTSGTYAQKLASLYDGLQTFITAHPNDVAKLRLKANSNTGSSENRLSAARSSIYSFVSSEYYNDGTAGQVLQTLTIGDSESTSKYINTMCTSTVSTVDYSAISNSSVSFTLYYYK